MDAKQANSVISKLANFFKAMPADVAHDIEDLWDDPHRVPGADEIKFGPQESASGDGASKMVKEYSSPAPQGGITSEYEKFNREMVSMRRNIDSVKSAVGAILSVIKSEAPKDDDEEKDTLVEKANSFVKRAGKMVTRAVIKGDMADTGEGDEDADEDFEKARTYLKKASALLVKAEEEDEDEDDVEKALKAIKSVRARLRKAEDEREEEKACKTKKDEDDTAKAKKAEGKDHERAELKDEEKLHEALNEALKYVNELRRRDEAAVKGDVEAANQSDKQDKESGNQDDEAKKSLTVIEDMLKAQNMTVQQMMSILGGQSKFSMPDFAKAATGKSMEIAKSIRDKADGMQLSDDAEIQLDSILNCMDQVSKGHLHESVLETRIKTASPAVQQLFAA